MRFLRRYCLLAVAAAGAVYLTHRPYGIPWVGAGASAALIVVAWRYPRWIDQAYAAGRSAGRVAQLEELDRLCELDPNATAQTALDHLDAIYVRDLTKETP